MRFGVPREAEAVERRVALVPDAVLELYRDDHEVVVQRGAGAAAGFPDAAYEAAGARLVETRREVIEGADVLVCLSRLLPEDLAVIRPDTPVLALHQLQHAPVPLRHGYAAAEVCAIGIDRLRDEAGEHPVLGALAELTGALVPSLAARLLESRAPGRAGLLLGRVPGLAPVEAVVLGALGGAAARALASVGALVRVLDPDPRRLRALGELPAGVFSELGTAAAVERALRAADVVVVAPPAVPGPVVLGLAQRRRLRPGVVVLDLTEGHSVEGARVVDAPEEAEVVDGVWCLSLAHPTRLVAHAASQVISASILPFVKLLGTGVTPKAHRVFAPAIYFGEGFA